MTSWYDFHRSASSTIIQKVQLRKEHITPYHEFVVVLTRAGRVYRVDRGREGPVLDTLREHGVQPVDTIALLPPSPTSLEQLDGTSHRVIDLCWGSDKTIDLKLVLDVCFQIHNNSGKRYKLLTHNCYFFAQTIIMIAVRKTVACKLDEVLQLENMLNSDVLWAVARSAVTMVITHRASQLEKLYSGLNGQLQLEMQPQRWIPGQGLELKLKLKLELERGLKRELELELEREQTPLWDLVQAVMLVLELALRWALRWELGSELGSALWVLAWALVSALWALAWTLAWTLVHVLPAAAIVVVVPVIVMVQGWKLGLVLVIMLMLVQGKQLKKQEKWGLARELSQEPERVQDWMRDREGKLWGEVAGGAARKLREQLSVELGKHLGLTLGTRLEASLGEQLGRQLGRRLGEWLGKHLGKELESRSVLRLMLQRFHRVQLQQLCKLELLLSQEALVEVLQLGLIGELEPGWHVNCCKIMVAAREPGHGGRWYVEQHVWVMLLLA